MSHFANQEIEEHVYNARMAFCFDHGLLPKDIMEDDKGEFIMSEMEDEDYSLHLEKVYLPEELQGKSYLNRETPDDEG